MAAKKTTEATPIFTKPVWLVGMGETAKGAVYVEIMIDEQGQPNLDSLFVSESDMRTIIMERVKMAIGNIFVGLKK